MNINVSVDCTPEEARRFMGLPDLTPVHEQYVESIVSTMKNGVQPEMLETMLKSWSPMGRAGMEFWRRLLETANKSNS